MYRPPDLSKAHHRLLLALACFDGEPSTEEIAAATGHKLGSCVAYLSRMVRDGLVIIRYADEDDPTTYRLSEAGERAFTEIIEATEPIKRLGGQRLSAQRMIARRRRQRQQSLHNHPQSQQKKTK